MQRLKHDKEEIIFRIFDPLFYLFIYLQTLPF